MFAKIIRCVLIAVRFRQDTGTEHEAQREGRNAIQRTYRLRYENSQGGWYHSLLRRFPHVLRPYRSSRDDYVDRSVEGQGTLEVHGYVSLILKSFQL